MLCLVAAWALTAQFRSVDLRCENLPEPTCIDSVSPRLSWRTVSAAPDWRQTGYRIVVSSTSQSLKSDKGDLWDSGKVEAADSVDVVYRGKLLTANEECFWKVRTWDASGRASSWSQEGKWEMGLLSPEDWGASRWIGSGQSGPAPFLRREFSLRGPVRRARLFACGLGYAELHLNGRPVAPGVEREAGYTNFDKRVLFVAYDVAPLLRRGPNCISASPEAEHRNGSL